MSNARIVIFALAAMTLPLGGAFARGAGGVTWSDQHYVEGFSNSTFSASEVGGFGYGVSSGGQRTGGFGYAIYSPQGTGSVVGGVGGAIIGQEVRAGPFTFAVNLWTGLGGVSATFAGTQSGLAVLFGEANLELGIAVTPWMQLSAYAGMQGLADIDPHSGIGTRLGTYSPVVGMRLSWGSFNAAW
ncbi:MAG: hypothetical protein ACLQCB_18425 [Spirochaetia bacterium]